MSSINILLNDFVLCFLSCLVMFCQFLAVILIFHRAREKAWKNSVRIEKVLPTSCRRYCVRASRWWMRDERALPRRGGVGWHADRYKRAATISPNKKWFTIGGGITAPTPPTTKQSSANGCTCRECTCNDILGRCTNRWKKSIKSKCFRSLLLLARN